MTGFTRILELPVDPVDRRGLRARLAVVEPRRRPPRHRDQPASRRRRGGRRWRSARSSPPPPTASRARGCWPSSPKRMRRSRCSRPRPVHGGGLDPRSSSATGRWSHADGEVGHRARHGPRDRARGARRRSRSPTTSVSPPVGPSASGPAGAPGTATTTTSPSRCCSTNLDAADRLGCGSTPSSSTTATRPASATGCHDAPTAFPSPLADLAGRIADTGRAAGIWTAPFLVGADSDLARDHPDWLVGGARGQRRALGTAHRGARRHPPGRRRAPRRGVPDPAGWGFSYHKIDFLYGGAMPGRRHADVTRWRPTARAAAGPGGDRRRTRCCSGAAHRCCPRSDGRRDAHLARHRPDWEPPLGDVSQPSGSGAVLAGRARAWQHGRWWVNDPDCITVRPGIDRRELWAGGAGEPRRARGVRRSDRCARRAWARLDP
jgi:hypothetical protein